MNYTNNQKAFQITALSLFACIAHGVMLFTPFNDYIYTSAVKFALFVICPIIYFTITKDGKFKDLFFFDLNSKTIKYSLLFGIFVFIFILLGFLAIRSWLEPEMIQNAMANVGITSGNYVFVALYYLIINVGLEELFFRGFIFLTLYRLGYKYYAHLFSALLFAVYHIAIMRYGVAPALLILATIGLIIVGFLFNEITRRCNNITGSYIAHASASLALILIGFYFMFY